MIKHPIYHEFNLDNMVGNSKPIRITHIDDTNVDVLELCVRQGGSKIDLTGATVTARIVLHAKRDYLINDNVQCTVNDSGNVLIPFDNAVIESQKGVLKIEVNIRRAEDVLTLQFPLWVIVNDTILAAAEVLPESEGTIPELLRAVEEELSRVKDFVDRDGVFEILDGALQGNQSVAPSLYVRAKGNNYALIYEDSNEETHELFDFSSLPASKGEKGEKGDKGDKGETGAAGADGKDGANGADGFSPVATVTKSGTVSTITVTDKNGTTTVTVNDGAKGDKGEQGEQGVKGVKGDKGDKGDTGAQGVPGQDYVLTAQDKQDIADIVLSEFTGSIINGELNTR